MKSETLKALNKARRERRPIVVATDTETGDQRVIETGDLSTH